MEEKYFDDEEYVVEGSTDEPVSNILDAGRYKFEVKDTEGYVSKAGNKCIFVYLDIDGKTIKESLMLEGRMEYKWRQFLYAIGIRDRRRRFVVNKSNIIGRKGIVDIGVKNRTLDDGSVVKENIVRFFSPIEKEEAPIKGVEPEIEPENKPEIEPETESEVEIEDEGIDDL